MKEVTFSTSDHLKIHATLVMPEQASEPLPGVITFHGMTSSETGYVPLLEELAKRGIAGLAVSMRGHGKSEGDFNVATVTEAIGDAVAAYDFLISQSGVDASRIGLVGSSVGAILAALTTSQKPIRSIVFRAPAAYTEQMMRLSMADTMVNEGRQFHEITDLKDTPAGIAVSRFGGSLLVAASENDATIPLKISKGYLDIADNASKKELIIIEEATHTLTNPLWKEAFIRATVDWLANTL